jgi:hypothetical protein
LAQRFSSVRPQPGAVNSTMIAATRSPSADRLLVVMAKNPRQKEKVNGEKDRRRPSRTFGRAFVLPCCRFLHKRCRIGNVIRIGPNGL